MAIEIPTLGLETTIQAYDNTGALAGTAVALCGHNNMSYAEGEPAAQDNTDFCSDAKEEIYGLPEVGNFDIDFTRFDPSDLGQKLLLTSPRNTTFQIKVTFSNSDVVTAKVRKRKNPDVAMSLDALKVTGSTSLALIGEPVWS